MRQVRFDYFVKVISLQIWRPKGSTFLSRQINIRRHKSQSNTIFATDDLILGI